MSLKHYGKKEVLALIDRMEDCFDRPFVYDQDRVEPRRGWAASAVEPGHWFYGIQIYGQARKYKTKPGEVLTLNVALYGFASKAEYLRVQTYLRVHGGWQLEAVSTLSVFYFGGGDCPRGGCLLIFFKQFYWLP